MNEVFLGIIAGAVLVMALVQLGVVVMAARATKQIGRLTATLEQDIRPIVANLQSMTSDAARATAVAATQVERADKLFLDLSNRLEQTIANVQATVQSTVAGATRGSAWLAGLKAAMAALRDLRTPASRRPAHAEEEDALFIG